MGARCRIIRVGGLGGGGGKEGGVKDLIGASGRSNPIDSLIEVTG